MPLERPLYMQRSYCKSRTNLSPFARIINVMAMMLLVWVPVQVNAHHCTDEYDCCIPLGGMVVYSAANDFAIACEDTQPIDFKVHYDVWNLRYTTTIASAQCSVGLNHDEPELGQNWLVQEQRERIGCLSEAHQACVFEGLGSGFAESLAPEIKWLQPEKIPKEDMPYRDLYFDEEARNANQIKIQFTQVEDGFSDVTREQLQGLADKLNNKDSLCKHVVIESYAQKRPGEPLAASRVAHDRAVQIQAVLISNGLENERIFIAAYGARFKSDEDYMVIRWSP